jgi:hypothetical protein
MFFSINGSRKTLVIMLFILAMASQVRAQDSKDLDNYRFRVEGNWWFSSPSGYFGARSNNSYFDINRDFGFGSYSTFSGKIDWRFGRKHHLLFTVAPVNNSRTVTLNRTVEFQGQTFDLGAQVSAHIRSLTFAPGYQYDIIRRDHGYLGLEVDFNLLDTEATLKTAANVNGVGGATSASKSFLAPLPAFGPTGRWYPLHNSNRLSLDGSFTGMSFFGYGNFIRTRANVGVGLTDHLALRAGYALGSRLSVHGTSDQIAVQFVQKGPTAGLEYSWGEAPGKKVHEPSSEPSDWHVDWVPFYLWFSGLEGNVGAQGYVAPVNVSFADVFSQLNIGYMSVLDVRRKRIGLLTDLVFISVSSDQKATPVGKLYSGFTANAKTFFLDPEGYYRLIEKDQDSVDVVAGARFWHLNNSLDLLQGTLSATSIGQTQSWVDPLLGARFRIGLPRNFFADLKGDAGGFGVGSQLTYQIYGGLGKELKQKYSLLLGYRYMSVDYKNGGFLYDIHMNGLLAGFNIHFK